MARAPRRFTHGAASALPVPFWQTPPLPPLNTDLTDPPADGRPKRHRGARGGKRHRRSQPVEESDQRPPEPEPEAAAPPEEPEAKPPRRRGSRGGRRHRRPIEPVAEEAPQALAPQPEPEPVPPAEEPEAKPPRRRGSRGGRRHRRPIEPVAEEAPQALAPQPEPEPVPPAEEPEPRPSRRRGARGGRRHRRATEPLAEEAPQALIPPEKAAPQPEAPAPRRGRGKKAEPAATKAPGGRRARTQRPRPVAKKAAETRRAIVHPRSKIPVTGAPTEVPAPFAHNAEYEFARILDFYGIDWRYEPRLFPLRWESGHVTEAFTPDFYLPDLNLYVELTTLKAGLTAEKNRKMRLMNELYPEINIILLKKRDYLRLLAKYGYGAISPDEVPDIHRILIPAARLQQRVSQLAAQISRDYAGKEPILIGVLRGVICFIGDLMRQISVPTSLDLMSISSYEGNGAAAVRILKDLDENIKGRDVILVEDIVDTGMTLNHIIEYLSTKRPASIKVCTLLDKRARRLINVPLDYVGFEIPDEFVVGYGLDYQQRFRHLPFVGILKHQLLP